MPKRAHTTEQTAFFRFTFSQPLPGTLGYHHSLLDARLGGMPFTIRK